MNPNIEVAGQMANNVRIFTMKLSEPERSRFIIKNDPLSHCIHIFTVSFCYINISIVAALKLHWSIYRPLGGSRTRRKQAKRVNLQLHSYRAPQMVSYMLCFGLHQP